ncbi:hypothetical protein [Polaribacter glomeratus]|uniref:Uncharacterized protein n=1 Tax=Polaribacter glomeratus TaxID=102 RepID=A0A2S7WV96_9FLAO|nr:hypothetical protein [Polaribacter glomeratus]PQJ81477.1 hypothetical protein BTO16_02315 [Polaribacter glomeratus]TXD64695.1 hypothetical protein ESX12_14255 [Polaribacter glomeratus]
MVATDVYTIAKALSKEEFIRLSDMLRKEVNQTKIKAPSTTKLPDFTMEDGLRFLLKHYIKKTIKT